MSKLDCNIVQDLLPAYIEKLTSTETTIAVDEHLKQCGECKSIYDEMISGEDINTESAKKEINYLKKVNKKTKLIITSVVLVAFIILAVPFCKIFVVGSIDNDYSIAVDVKGNELNVRGSITSSIKDVSNVKFDYDNGVVTVNVYTRTPLNKNGADGSFELSYVAVGDIVKVQSPDGKTFWDGIEIERKTEDIFNSKVKYVGSPSDVSKLLTSINLNDLLECSNYLLKLHTDKEPYGLEIYNIKLNDNNYLSDENYNRNVKNIAIVILACIDNIDYVKINYSEPVSCKKSILNITCDDVENELSYNPKEASQSLRGLQQLINDTQNMLLSKNELEYETTFDCTTADTLEKINSNPIDKKYLALLHDCNGQGEEYEVYNAWIDAYNKQYKVFYGNLCKYPDMTPEISKHLKPLENVNDTADDMANLYYASVESVAGRGTGLAGIYLTEYFYSLRHKTLQLAECAYYLGVEFEWVE